MSSTLQFDEAGASDIPRRQMFNKDNSDHGWGVLPYADIPIYPFVFLRDGNNSNKPIFITAKLEISLDPNYFHNLGIWEVFAP